MTMPAIHIGRQAVLNLRVKYPAAHTFFGEHVSADHFIAAITQPGWTVYECEECWLIAQDVGDWARSIHWFCPEGVKMGALRRMLSFLFATTGAEVVVGAIPDELENWRASRVVARAIGAERQGDTYMLSHERFVCYTSGNRAEKTHGRYR